jgi:hypothetical protein
MRRRAFVGGALAGVGITGAYAAPPKVRAGDIPMREYRKTGVMVQFIAQGGAGCAGTGTTVPEMSARRAGILVYPATGASATVSGAPGALFLSSHVRDGGQFAVSLVGPPGFDA